MSSVCAVYTEYCFGATRSISGGTIFGFSVQFRSLYCSFDNILSWHLIGLAVLVTFCLGFVDQKGKNL